MRLKDTFIPVCILLLSSLFGSCEDDSSDYDSSTPVPVVFTPVIDENDQAFTRVVDTSWSGNEVIGIHMLSSGGSLATGAIFSQYKTTDSGAKASFTPTATDQTLYYPVDGSNVNFYAFSPYQAPSSNRVTYAATDQSTQAKMEAIDFIWAKATGTYNKKSADVKLDFTHKQSKIVLTVSRGANVSATDISNPGFSLQNFPTSSTYNLSDGTQYARSTTSTITPYQSSSNSTSVTWQAIIVPHTGSGYATRKFVFTFNGKNYTYTLDTTQNFETNKKYTYNLKLTTAGIVLTETKITDWSTGTASWDDKYTLTTDVSSVNFTSSQGTRYVTIKTTSDNKPTVVTSSKPNWITTASLGSAKTEGSWKIYTLSLTASANAEATRTGIVELTVEGLTIPITVIQRTARDISNCYIIRPGGYSALIDVERANNFGAMLSPAKTVASVKVLWQDGNCVMDVGMFTNDIIEVSSTRADQGNAIIAACAADGTILWSYHIWVTTYVPTGLIMDRNLGAISSGIGNSGNLGLLYQWGRKDPFPGSGNAFYGTECTLYNGSLSSFKYEMKSTSVSNAFPYATLVTGTKGVDWSVQNPMTFIGYYELWTGYEAGLEQLWNQNGSKTIYDPCPKGWRVASSFDMLYGYVKSCIDLGTGVTKHYNYGIDSGLGSWPITPSRNGVNSSGLGALPNDLSADWAGMYWTGESGTSYGSGGVALRLKYNNSTNRVDLEQQLTGSWSYCNDGQSVRCVADNV